MLRRTFLYGGFCATLALSAAPAQALTTSDASELVRRIVDRVLALVRDNDDNNSKVDKFRALMNETAAMPQIAQFAIGAPWREMNEAQQSDFKSAFNDYIAFTYVRRFRDYAGETVDIGRGIDAGRKGVLVESSVNRASGPPVNVGWLVSDRGGSPQLVDIVVEGVSLTLTQREEFASMMERNGGDIDKFISELRGRSGG